IVEEVGAVDPDGFGLTRRTAGAEPGDAADRGAQNDHHEPNAFGEVADAFRLGGGAVEHRHGGLGGGGEGEEWKKPPHHAMMTQWNPIRHGSVPTIHGAPRFSPLTKRR